MKKNHWIVLSAAVAAALPWAACGSGATPGTGGTSAGSGGSAASTTTTTSSHSSSHATTTTTSGSSSSSSGTGGTGGAPTDCTGIVTAGTCGDCLVASCCQQLSDCNNDANCLFCIQGTTTGTACMTTATAAAITALTTCQTMNCNTQCTPVSSCNPVTNAGCDTAAGEACDLDTGNIYNCFPAPNTGTLCTTCSYNSGPFCEGTTHCIDTNSSGDNGQCARFCCNDGDCGGGTCDMTTLPGGAGVCVLKLDAGVDAGDAGSPPSCDVDGGSGPPAVAPSMGSCVTFQPAADGGTDAAGGG